MRLQLPPWLGFLPTALGLALLSAMAFRWLAPSWWPVLAGIGFALQVRLRSGLPWIEALAIWVGQALALAVTRGFHGVMPALFFTAPWPVWSILLPLVSHYSARLWDQLRDRLDPGKRRWAFPAAAVGLPTVLAAAGAEVGHGLAFAAFGLAVAARLTGPRSAESVNWFWLALGGICGLAFNLAAMGAVGALQFMPYETLRFLTAPVAGYVIWSIAGAIAPLRAGTEHR